MPPPISEPGDHIAADILHYDVSTRSVRGGTVAVVAQFAKLAVQLGAIVLLARLVTPEAFGLVAMVVVVIAFLELFRDLGLASVTVQRAEITDVEVSTLFWAGTVVSIAMFLAVWALGPLLSMIYGRDELTEIAAGLGFGVVLGGLATQHLAILRRQMRFAALAAAEIVAAVAGIITAVIVAMMDGGVWALIAQRLVWSGTLALGAWTLCGWRPGVPAWNIALGRLVGTGGGAAVSSVASMAARTFDHALIGWMWGASVLGLYDRASGLLTAPTRSVNTPLMISATPLLRRLMERPQRYRRAYLRMFEAICMVSMPAAALLVATPDWVVAVLLGPQWADAAGIALWLAVAALYRPAANTAGWLLVSQGRTAELTRWSVAGAALRIAAIVAGVPFGVAGVAAALAISGLVVRLPLLFWLVGRKGPVSARDLYTAMSASVIAAGAVFGAVWGARQVPALMPPDPAAALGAALCLAILAALVCFAGLPRGRRALRDVRSVTSSLFSVEARL